MKELIAALINGGFVIAESYAFIYFGYKLTMLILIFHVVFLLSYIITSTKNINDEKKQ